jgi:hypothetical protein
MTERGQDEFAADEYEPDSELDEVSADVPEADAVEQHQSLDGGESDSEPVVIPRDAPEADVLEQWQDLDDDEEPYESSEEP